jgi:hypothetical protein
MHPIYVEETLKTVKIFKKSSINMFSYSFSKIMQFRVHISAPNLQIRIYWILTHLLTPLGHLGVCQ